MVNATAVYLRRTKRYVIFSWHLAFFLVGYLFLVMTHIFFQFFRETFVPKKTTTNMNLPIICKACWAWMMWQGIIYGWLHLNRICSPFTSFLPFYVPPCFQGLDLIQPTSSFGQKDPSFVFFLRRPSFMVSILGLVLAPVAGLCLSSIFTVLARAQKWQLWSPRSQFTTP